ncbi:MAG: hypothetical protein AAF558_14030 [Verrucomicrobiota bacterium]
MSESKKAKTTKSSKPAAKSGDSKSAASSEKKAPKAEAKEAKKEAPKATKKADTTPIQNGKGSAPRNMGPKFKKNYKGIRWESKDEPRQKGVKQVKVYK